MKNVYLYDYDGTTAKDALPITSGSVYHQENGNTTVEITCSASLYYRGEIALGDILVVPYPHPQETSGQNFRITEISANGDEMTVKGKHVTFDVANAFCARWAVSTETLEGFVKRLINIARITKIVEDANGSTSGLTSAEKTLFTNSAIFNLQGINFAFYCHDSSSTKYTKKYKCDIAMKDGADILTQVASTYGMNIVRDCIAGTPTIVFTYGSSSDYFCAKFNIGEYTAIYRADRNVTGYAMSEKIDNYVTMIAAYTEVKLSYATDSDKTNRFVGTYYNKAMSYAKARRYVVLKKYSNDIKIADYKTYAAYLAAVDKEVAALAQDEVDGLTWEGTNVSIDATALTNDYIFGGETCVCADYHTQTDFDLRIEGFDYNLLTSEFTDIELGRVTDKLSDLSTVSKGNSTSSSSGSGETIAYNEILEELRKRQLTANIVETLAECTDDATKYPSSKAIYQLYTKEQAAADDATTAKTNASTALSKIDTINNTSLPAKEDTKNKSDVTITADNKSSTLFPTTNAVYNTVATKENTSNKSDSTITENNKSSTLFPTTNAVWKAVSPKEDTANKSDDTITSANKSSTKFPTTNAVYNTVASKEDSANKKDDTITADNKSSTYFPTTNAVWNTVSGLLDIKADKDDLVADVNNGSAELLKVLGGTLGLNYSAVETKDSSGTVTGYNYYLSDKTDLASSKVVIKLSAGGMLTTTDYQGTDEATEEAGKWASAISTDGNAFFPNISTYQLSASNIKSGTLSSLDGTSVLFDLNNNKLTMNAGEINLGTGDSQTDITATKAQLGNPLYLSSTYLNSAYSVLAVGADVVDEKQVAVCTIGRGNTPTSSDNYIKIIDVGDEAQTDLTVNCALKGTTNVNDISIGGNVTSNIRVADNNYVTLGGTGGLRYNVGGSSFANAISVLSNGNMVIGGNQNLLINNSTYPVYFGNRVADANKLTDWVYANGTSDNWYYRKWHGGVFDMMCYHKNITISTWTAITSGWYKGTATLTLPFTMDTVYSATANTYNSNFVAGQCLVSGSTLTLTVWASQSSVSSIYVNVSVSGTTS